MNLISKLKLLSLFLILLNFGYGQQLFPSEESVSENENKWDNQFQTGKLKFYSNYLSSNSANKFYARFYWEWNYFSYGLRLGDEINESSPNIERDFIKMKYNNYFIQFDSYKIKTGKGLSFGSDYGF